jgi:hypothetical protein
MNETFRDLYNQLLKEIEDCEKTNTDFRKHIECCFHASERINSIADKKINELKFVSEEEEIQFFKSFKPKFTCLVEFYSIVYRAVLFEPETERTDYWKSELKRASQFLEENKLFQDYINNGDTSKDNSYFSAGSVSSSHYQHLLAQIKAREIYVEFVNRRLTAHTN